MHQKFKQEIYFKQLTGFNFYIDQQKGTFLAESVITHFHNNTEYQTTEHFTHTRELLSAPCVIA